MSSDELKVINEKQKNFRKLNLEKTRSQNKIYKSKPEAKVKAKIAKRIWRENKRKEDPDFFKKQRKNNPNTKKNDRKASIKAIENLRKDPIKKLRSYVSRSILIYLKNNFASKNGLSYLSKIGYTIEELKTHLESLFESWMNWDNQGQYKIEEWDDNDPSTWKWQLDHIKPHSIFKYTSMEDQAFKDCWALTNLRPLSAKQNVIDGATRARHKKEK